MVINQPTTFPNLNLVSDLDPGFLFFFSTPSPPWGLVDTRHGTGIFGLQKQGGGRWVFFFFSDEVDVFFFVGGYFWNVFFGDFLMFFFFWMSFFGIFGSCCCCLECFFQEKLLQFIYTFLFFGSQFARYFFFSSHFMNSGGTSRVFFVASTKLRRFSVSSFLRVVFCFSVTKSTSGWTKS